MSSSITLAHAPSSTPLCSIPLIVLPGSCAVLVSGIALIILHYLFGAQALLLPGAIATTLGGATLLGFVLAACHKRNNKNSQSGLVPGGVQVNEMVVYSAETGPNHVLLNPQVINHLFPNASEDATDTYVWIGNYIYKAVASDEVKVGQLGVSTCQHSCITQTSAQAHTSLAQTFLITPVTEEVQAASKIVVTVTLRSEVSSKKKLEAPFSAVSTFFKVALSNCNQMNIGKTVFLSFETVVWEFKITRAQVVDSKDADSKDRRCLCRDTVFKVNTTTPVKFKVSEQSKSHLTINQEKNTESETGKAKKEEKPFDLMEELEKEGIVGLPDSFATVIDTISASHGDFKALSKDRGIAPEKGIILYGPPGTGKTSIARVIGKALGCDEEHLILKSCTELMDKYVGETEKAVAKLFAPAKKAKEQDLLHVIILDEIDALLGDREMQTHSFEVTRVNAFLSAMDGLDQSGNFLVIGMTNRFNSLDPAVKRSGRFGTCVKIDVPDEQQRAAIFIKRLEPLRTSGCLKNLDEQQLIPQLAKQMDNFSGADIKGVIDHANKKSIARLRKVHHQNASIDVATHPEGMLTQQDFESGIRAIQATKKGS